MRKRKRFSLTKSNDFRTHRVADTINPIMKPVLKQEKKRFISYLFNKYFLDEDYIKHLPVKNTLGVVMELSAVDDVGMSVLLADALFYRVIGVQHLLWRFQAPRETYNRILVQTLEMFVFGVRVPLKYTLKADGVTAKNADLLSKALLTIFTYELTFVGKAFFKAVIANVREAYYG